MSGSRFPRHQIPYQMLLDFPNCICPSHWFHPFSGPSLHAHMSPWRVLSVTPWADGHSSFIQQMATEPPVRAEYHARYTLEVQVQQNGETETCYVSTNIRGKRVSFGEQSYWAKKKAPAQMSYLHWEGLEIQVHVSTGSRVLGQIQWYLFRRLHNYTFEIFIPRITD